MATASRMDVQGRRVRRGRLRDQGSRAGGGRRPAARPRQLRRVRPGLADDDEDFAALQRDARSTSSLPRSPRTTPSNWGDMTILRSIDDVAALKQTDGGTDPRARQRRARRSARGTRASSTAITCSCSRSCSARASRLFNGRETGKPSLVEHEAYSNGIVKNVFDVVRCVDDSGCRGSSRGIRSVARPATNAAAGCSGRTRVDAIGRRRVASRRARGGSSWTRCGGSQGSGYSQ